MILKCTCTHKAQDKLHGKGKRVHNACKVIVGDDPKFRCTVCERTRTK